MLTDSSAPTETPDTLYSLIRLLYHELRQAESCTQSIREASDMHDEALADFFHECQESSRALADRAKALLATRLTEAAATHQHDDELVEESSRLSFPASDAPAY